MKHKVKQEGGFNPVKIEITLETLLELKHFCGMLQQSTDLKVYNQDQDEDYEMSEDEMEKIEDMELFLEMAKIYASYGN